MALKGMAMRFAAQALNLTGGWPFSGVYGGLGHILMFHRIRKDASENRIWANAYLEVTTNFLGEVIGYFKKHGYHFASLDDIPECIKNRRRFVVFTFDDGFKDNLELGYPVLSRHGVPMTVFVTTGFPEHSAMLWWNEVERLLLARQSMRVTLGEQTVSLDLSTQEQKESAFKLIARHIRNAQAGTINERIAALYSQFDIDPHASVKELALSWDALSQLSRLPAVSIGAHTLNHPVLSKLTGSECRDELSGSKRLLEQKLGREITQFAYTYGGPGDIGQRDALIAQEVGFKSAVTTYSSNIHAAHLDFPFQLPRIAVGMSMTSHTFDLIRHGVIPMIRNRGRRVVKID